MSATRDLHFGPVHRTRAAVPDRRWLAATAAAVWLAVACQSTEPTQRPPGRVAWGNRVPTPGPSAIAAQVVVARDSGSVTLLPISPTGAELGKDYGYVMPHCGAHSPIDVDGSFWDPLGTVDSPPSLDGQAGVFRLLSPGLATFTIPGGLAVQLARHPGAKTFAYCL